MITLLRSTTSYHIADPTTGLALCGFPNKAKEKIELDRLEDRTKGERLCARCEERHLRPADRSMEAKHLRHKISQMVELKDALMRGEISYRSFRSKAYPLQKEIEALEAQRR